MELIKKLDYKSNCERLEIITAELQKMNVTFFEHKYSTGTNLIVDLGNGKKKIGIGSHYDRVQNSGGANDNASAIAVCFDIISKFRKSGNHDLGIRLFFFDEEETGLRGSRAYINKYGINDMIGLINLELVGMGDIFALWSVHNQASGLVLRAFEFIANSKNIMCKRFDQVITNTADHVSFRVGGLPDSFTLTCISNQDIEVVNRYYASLDQGANNEELFSILSRAPIFQHYHQPSDTFDKLQQESIKMTSATIWETILELPRNLR